MRRIFRFETEPNIDEFANPIIYIPTDIYYDNNCFYEDDGNTKWRIRVTIEWMDRDKSE